MKLEIELEADSSRKSNPIHQVASEKSDDDESYAKLSQWHARVGSALLANAITDLYQANWSRTTNFRNCFDARISPQQSSLNLSPHFVSQYERTGIPSMYHCDSITLRRSELWNWTEWRLEANIWGRLFVKLIPQMFMKHASFDRQPSRNISISRCRPSYDRLITETTPICEASSRSQIFLTAGRRRITNCLIKPRRRSNQFQSTTSNKPWVQVMSSEYENRLKEH